jgi:hypothetical protein
VKRAEPKTGKSSDDLNAAHGQKIVEHQSAEGVVTSAESSNDVGLGSVPKEIVGTEENNGVKVQPMGRSNQGEKETNSGHSMHAQ